MKRSILFIFNNLAIVTHKQLLNHALVIIELLGKGRQKPIIFNVF